MRCPSLHRAFLAAALAGIFPHGPAPLWAKPHAKHAARDQVIALENQWAKAQMQDDVAAMDRLLSPDFLGINVTGEVVTKTQQLDRMRNRTVVIRSLQISDVRVKLLGQHAASVTSLAEIDGTSDGHPLIGHFRYTHVFQRTANGTWNITNFEATRAPGNADAASMGTAQPPRR